MGAIVLQKRSILRFYHFCKCGFSIVTYHSKHVLIYSENLRRNCVFTLLKKSLSRKLRKDLKEVRKGKTCKLTIWFASSALNVYINIARYTLTIILKFEVDIVVSCYREICYVFIWLNVCLLFIDCNLILWKSFGINKLTALQPQNLKRLKAARLRRLVLIKNILLPYHICQILEIKVFPILCFFKNA